MMKTLSRLSSIVLLLLAVHGPASAQAICRVYEYAELKDMSQDKLLEMRCNYYSSMRELLKIAIVNIQGGRSAAAQQDQRDSNRCAQEMTRMENVLESKFGMKEFPKCAVK